MHELLYTLDTIDDVALDLKNVLDRCAVMTFTGSLGAGKTTLIQALLRTCGIEGQIQSPTFTYLNQYVNSYNQAFYHFDLYRLASAQDFKHAGFHEYLYQPQSWALIEWPEIIRPLLSKNVCHCSIDYCGTDRRRLVYETVTQR